MPAWADRWLRPREGWLSLGLLAVMLLALAWSVQKAAWLNHLEFLVPVALAGVAIGAVLGLTRWSVVLTLPLSAIAGTGVVLWAIGGEYFPEMSRIHRLLEMRADLIDWVRILVDRGSPPQLVPYAVALGIVMWVTAFVAGYAVYRNHKILDAVVLVGGLLIANMSATYTDLFIYLILFVLAAMLLWLRGSLISREEGWARRRVTENPDVPGAIMRSGVSFIVGSIVLAWIFTSVAVAAPLTGVWNNLNGVWQGVQDQFQGLVGGLNRGDARITGTGFGDSFSVSGTWVSSDEPIMTVTADRGYYMRAKTYDVYTGHGWEQSSNGSRRVEAGDPLFPGDTPERPVYQEAFDLVSVAVVVNGPVGSNIFAPEGFPTSALAPVNVREIDGTASLTALDATSTIAVGDGYVVTSMVSNASKAELAAAGQNYPADITRYYLGTKGVSEATRQLAQEIVDRAGATNPFAEADALANYLQRDPSFSYSPKAPVPANPDQDLVDFFLFSPQGRVGYCEYYATAMAVMARTLGLPARVARGYAPGERIEDGVYQVRAKNSHAWAEIYFPGYGWQIFEATKSIPSIVRLPGADTPLPTRDPNASIPPRFPEGADLGFLPSNIPSFDPLQGGYLPGETPPPPDSRGGNTLIIVMVILAVLLVAGWRLWRARSTWRFLAPGEQQWRRLAIAAGRAGVAQRPSETIYEYAGWLEEQIPDRAPEIRTIADGKVWQSYSGRRLTYDLGRRVQDAWKRLQLPLTWLAIRHRIAGLLPRRRPRG